MLDVGACVTKLAGFPECLPGGSSECQSDADSRCDLEIFLDGSDEQTDSMNSLFQASGASSSSSGGVASLGLGGVGGLVGGGGVGCLGGGSGAFGEVLEHGADRCGQPGAIWTCDASNSARL